MAHIPVPDGVKVVMNYTKAGQKCANVFWVKVTAAIDVALLEAIGNTFRSAWQTYLFGYTSGDVSLNSITISDQSVVGGIGIEYTTGMPLTGTPGLVGTPNNVTLATKLLTGLTGRSFRGRFYFLGIAPTYLQTDQQHVLTIMVTQLTNFVLNLISEMQLQGHDFAVASLYSGVDVDGKPIPRAAGILTPITNVAVNNTIDSQRRRLPERGS